MLTSPASLFPQLNSEIGRGVGNVNEVKDKEDFNPAALSQAAEHVEVLYRATPSFEYRKNEGGDGGG